MTLMTAPEPLPPDLYQQVAVMLIRLGLPPDTLNTLDAHQTIALTLQGLPDVMLSFFNHRLWIWSLLPCVTESILIDYATSVLPVLITTVEGIEGGQLTLGEGQEGFELKAQVNLELLVQEESLTQVVQSFINLLKTICYNLLPRE